VRNGLWQASAVRRLLVTCARWGKGRGQCWVALQVSKSVYFRQHFCCANAFIVHCADAISKVRRHSGLPLQSLHRPVCWRTYRPPPKSTGQKIVSRQSVNMKIEKAHQSTDILSILRDKLTTKQHWTEHGHSALSQAQMLTSIKF